MKEPFRYSQRRGAVRYLALVTDYDGVIATDGQA
jgi:hypothetical protein